MIGSATAASRVKPAELVPAPRELPLGSAETFTVLGGDHAGLHPKHPSRTYGSPKARGLGMPEKLGTGLIVGAAALYACALIIPLVVSYYIQKAAVHNGIREAARDGSLGTPLNRLNAGS